MRKHRVVVMPAADGQWEVWDMPSRWDEFWITRRRWGLWVALRNLWDDMTHKTISREND